MGQPYQGQGGGAGGRPWSPPQGAEPPPRRSRAGLWVALGCVGLVIVLLLLAATGGVILLATREGASESEQVEVSEEYFTLRYPPTWFRVADTPESEDSGRVLEIADEEIPADAYDEEAPNTLSVYAYTADLHARRQCERQSIWLGTFWDSTEDAVELDSVEIDGRDLVGWRVVGVADGQDAVSEIYCADVADEVLEIVVETRGATEISPELHAVLDSWTWTDAA